MRILTSWLAILLVPLSGWAAPDDVEISGREKITNFATVYLAQWIFYGATQAQTIREHGSFQNMREYPFQTRFDRDDYNYNVVKHSLAGQYYYLFYRSRGYGVKQAFASSAASSFAFEFFVETMTERPSYQDLYQTPVFGTVLGIGAEKLSLTLVRSENVGARFLGYVVNPFLLFPDSNFRVSFIPLGGERTRILLTGEF